MSLVKEGGDPVQGKEGIFSGAWDGGWGCWGKGLRMGRL